MGPLVVLFELSLILARFFERSRGPGGVPSRWSFDGDDEDDDLYDEDPGDPWESADDYPGR
jgi:hypothetical protein